jgi:hypothetical protein
MSHIFSFQVDFSARIYVYLNVNDSHVTTCKAVNVTVW